MRQASRFKRICVFCGSSAGNKTSYRDAAVELAKELAKLLAASLMASPVGSMSMLPSPPYNVRKLMDAINREKFLLAQIKKEKLRLADMKKTQGVLSFLSFLVICLWAIFSACFHCVVLNIFGPSTSHQQCLESMTCAVIDAIPYWLLCCSVLQAAAAVLPLLFTCRRRRRTLGFTTVATTATGHCMYGWIQWLLLATSPGDGGIISSFLLAIIFLVGDLLCFLLLTLVGVIDEMREVSKV